MGKAEVALGGAIVAISVGALAYILLKKTTTSTGTTTEPLTIVPPPTAPVTTSPTTSTSTPSPTPITSTPTPTLPVYSTPVTSITVTSVPPPTTPYTNPVVYVYNPSYDYVTAYINSKSKNAPVGSVQIPPGAKVALPYNSDYWYSFYENGFFQSEYNPQPNTTITLDTDRIYNWWWAKFTWNGSSPYAEIFVNGLLTTYYRFLAEANVPTYIRVPPNYSDVDITGPNCFISGACIAAYHNNLTCPSYCLIPL